MSEAVFQKEFFEEVLRPGWEGPAFSGGGGFAIDSRRLERGDVFVALRTGRRDGHEFLPAAAEAGAAAALVSSPRPDLDLPQIVVPDTLAALQSLGAAWRLRWGRRIVAVTGSCGKTSTKELLGLLLGRDDTHVSPGNLNNHIGVPLSLLLLRDHHRRAVIEAGINQGGEMAQLASWIRPEAAVVTTIGPAHLEKLGSMEGIAREKSQLPLAAADAVFLGPACADYEAFTAASFPSATWVLPRARGTPEACRGEVWNLEISGGEVRLCRGAPADSPLRYPAPEATAGMLENTALALLAARAEGVPEEDLRERLAGWRPASQRGEILERGGRAVYADHYNANPASFADAVHYFDRRFPAPPRCWVIGAMEELGPESAVWHRKLAAALPVKEGDRVFLVGAGAAEMQPILAARLGVGAVFHAPEAGGIAAEVAASPGTVFLKGSRRHALEKVLDSLAAAG